VNALPDASLVGLTTSTICHTDSLHLDGVALNGTPSWTHNGTGVLSSSTIVNPYYNPAVPDAGKTVILNFIVSDLTCTTVLTDTAKYTLNIYALPTQPVNVGNDTTISLGSSVQLHAKGSSIVTWNWKPSISLDDEFIANPIASPLDSTTYTVIATHFNGCTSRDTIVVYVLKDHQLVISNMMSPNGDGKNDTWGIGNIENYPGTEVIVVNREGEIVFESQDYKNEWDGKYKGKFLPDATYYYIVKFADSDKVYKGAITLLQGNK
jgi:gliding motility-associated-like protein